MTCTTRHLLQARTVVFGSSHALNNDAPARACALSSLNDADVAALCLHPRRG